MKIFASGGAGFNIASRFLKNAGKSNHGFADIECVFIDTSKSNMNPNIPQSQIYMIEGKDGAGKFRKGIYQAVKEACPDILLQHKPADVNIILSSGGGGSGSVIGPVLTSELLDRGEIVIVLTIGSTSSQIETKNTLDTLRSYETIAQTRDMPVVMAYRENSPEASRGQNDSEIEAVIMYLAAIFSGNNRELDMSDLRNFVNYSKLTNYKPQLSYLEICSGNKLLLQKGQALISLVTLADENTSSEINMQTQYQAVGYIPEAAKDVLGGQMPIHAAIITGYFNSQVERLESKMRGYDEVRKTVNEKSIVDKNTASTDDGLVF